MDKLKLSIASSVTLVAGAVMLISSFLTFHKFTLGSFAKSVNAWGSGLFLIATIPALLGALMAIHIALESYAPHVSLPERVLGFTWTQVHLILSLQATIMMLAFLVQDISGARAVGIHAHKGIGLYLMLLSAIALLVGAALRMRERPGPATFG